MQPGNSISQFKLLEVIGRGGMGEVWRAHDTRLERDVALKTLPAPAANAESLARLRREARILATLNHPNIGGILGLEEQDGRYWLVLELVEGPTLEERLQAGKLGVHEATDIALQIADALQGAHVRGIIHCDLKPSNIKVSAQGRVKVLDFGIARSEPVHADSNETTVTNPPAKGEVAGTPVYMSPEQARGEPVGPPSDIWAFGVLLYRMLAGRLSFAGRTAADTLAQVLQTAPDLTLLRPQVPDALIRLLRRCLEKDPQRRLQHAGDLRILIEEALLSDLPGSKVPKARRGLVIAIIGVVVMTAALAWYFHDRFPASGSNSAGAQLTSADPSIAVLPFVNMSADPEQEYFSDGLSEELINQLAHIEGLRVTARTSAFAFKGKAQDLRNVGQALGVAHILEGSVRKSGGRIRITAQLINVSTGYHVWSETFDRAVNDVFAIQDEIATTVAAKLGPSLGVAPRTFDFGGTRSLEAYDHLLRGTSEFNKFSPESLLAAIAEYRAALAIDPSYARASAELAITLSAVGPGAGDTTAFNLELEEIIARAVASAPDAPLTHVAQMWFYSDRHEWIKADDACRAAFAGGNDPRAKGICAGFLTLTGRIRAAVPYREAARRADPLSISTTNTVVRQYAILEMGPELQREFRRVEGLTGARRQADEAMLAYLAHRRASPEEINTQLARTCTNQASATCDAWTAAIRTPQEAPRLLRAQLQRVAAATPAAAAAIALAAAYLGETSLALDAIEVFTAKNAGTPAYQNLWFPLLGEVRKEARFKRIMRELGLVELWKHTGNWADFCHPVGDDDFECS